MKKPLLIIAGGTATGKSDAAVALAHRIGGEIISADSMQVYKHMTIGTAKPSIEEMQGIPHYLVDELMPDEEYSAAIFQKKAQAHIGDITSRGKTPIVCGGTGFYINALLYGTDFTETETDTTLRDELQAIADAEGQEAFHARLAAIDHAAAQAIHANNVRRVIRALEYHAQTGRRISEHNAEQKQREADYNAQTIILTRDRLELYDRIDKRVDIMIERGLIDEVQWLLDAGYHEKLPSMRGLGYKEIAAYLRGAYSLDEAVRILKRDTRHFAKRQRTWFRHQAPEGTQTVMMHLGEDANAAADKMLPLLRI